jgi:lipopolysaccharide biosynthesis glycosyltransferase
METKLPFTVVTGIDDNYVLPFLVMVYSAKINAREKFHVTLGFDPLVLSEDSQDLVAQVLRIIEVPFDFVKLTLSSEMEARGHISATSYSRLLLADQISGLMLWLDSDLICLPGWDSIFLEKNNLPNGMVLSVVRDAFVSTSNIEYISSSSNESIRIMGRDYFNSGVALIDCDLWRSLSYPNLWPSVLKESNSRGFEYADQCVLNFLCQREVNFLPWKYNALAQAKWHSRESRPFILHFAAGPKPWYYAKTDPRVLTGKLFPRDIFLYLSYQSQLIKTVDLENNILGSILKAERRRIRNKWNLRKVLSLPKKITGLIKTRRPQ